MAALLTAFVSIFIAEFGDKTQLVSLTMAGRYPPWQVLGGAMTALFLVLALAVGAGSFIAAYIPTVVITVTSGALFIVMGVYTLLKREPEAAPRPGSKAGFFQTLGLIFVAEMGDKTQMAAMLLSANFDRPLAVLAGAMLAMLANHALAVFLGAHYISRFPPRHLKLGTGILFIVIGGCILLLGLFGK